jgi:transketolase
VSNFFAESAEKCSLGQKEWSEAVHQYRQEDNDLAAMLSNYLSSSINPELEKSMPGFSAQDKPIATRSASEIIMNSIEKLMPEFIGGSADLNPSTKTFLKGFGDVGVGKGCARNLHYGVREHAMAAITNGMALHGGLIPYCATFLIFSDYMKPAIRIACLMQSHSIFVFTHDSIALGEDGPTHQPVEQLSSLRMIPGITLFRPADANETSAAWYQAIIRKKPCVLVFTRQALPILDADKHNIFSGTAKGAYILADTADKAEIIIIATGSEVHLALASHDKLTEKGIKCRVVSMPSYEIFMEQSCEYRNHIIPAEIKKRIVIEAGATAFWRGLAGDMGEVIGVDKFGASAPGNVVMDKYGFNVNNVVEKAMLLLNPEKK